MGFPWKRSPALIVLEDGTVFKGRAFAGSGKALGEVVFNTGMAGYQEILTDPSYKGQMVVMTYPLTGNYGINAEDMESSEIQVEAFIIKEYQDFPSNWRSEKTLSEFLEEHGKIGIEAVDTRAITRHIRLAGAMRGIIATEVEDTPEVRKRLLEEVLEFPGLVGIDMVKRVTCKEPYLWVNNRPNPGIRHWLRDHPGFRIAAFDFGIKYNILRNLERQGCQVLVFPAETTAEEILSYDPDGIFLSNGPGDPAAVTYAIKTTRALLGSRPMFGICLGHQLMGLALGGRTFKLKFGHRGVNQPVKDLTTGKIEITSQNHGFCVDPDSLSHLPVKFTHINLNDETLEGLEHREIPAFSVQYHPEASPGPHDATYLFERFIGAIKHHRRRRTI